MQGDWNKDRLDTLAERVEQVSEQVATLSERMDAGFKAIDKRFEQVDKRFEQVDKRFQRVERRLDLIEAGFEGFGGQVGRLEDRFDRHQHTLLVVALTLVASLIATCVTVLASTA